MPLRSSIIENYTYKKGSLSSQIIHNMFVLRRFYSNWLSFSFREQGIRILGRHWLAVVSHSIKIEHSPISRTFLESKPQIVSDFRATLWLHLSAPIYTFIHVYNTVQLYSYRTSLYNCTLHQLNYSDCH